MKVEAITNDGVITIEMEDWKVALHCVNDSDGNCTNPNALKKDGDGRGLCIAKEGCGVVVDINDINNRPRE